MTQLLKPISKRERTLWRLAIHEAAHAIVAARFGATEGEVSIGRRDDGNIGRSTLVAASVDDSTEFAVRVAATCVAGLVAEQLFVKSDPAYPLANKVPCLSPVEIPALPGLSDTDIVVEVARIMDRGTEHEGDEQHTQEHARRLTMSASWLAADMLEIDELAVRTLALELISNHVVSATRVREILFEQDTQRFGVRRLRPALPPAQLIRRGDVPMADSFTAGAPAGLTPCQ